MFDRKAAAPSDTRARAAGACACRCTLAIAAAIAIAIAFVTLGDDGMSSSKLALGEASAAAEDSADRNRAAVAAVRLVGRLPPHLCLRLRQATLCRSGWTCLSPPPRLLQIPAIGSIARADQQLNCSMRGSIVLWSQLPESVTDYRRPP